MSKDLSTHLCDLSLADLLQTRRRVEREETFFDQKTDYSSWTFRMKLGRETIHLDLIEFRILSVLAAKPYYPFTPRRIVNAVSTERHPLAEESLDRYITSLRRKLGFFRDCVQAVPFIGYCFKP